jgi:hypothetical protein
VDLRDLETGTEHERVVECIEPAASYHAIIAIHSTVLGPAVGGSRLWSYDSTHAALADALRLSRGMTLKCAAAGLDLGGGKAVLMAPPSPVNREPLFRAHGRAIQQLGGRFITGEDVGTSPSDMEYVFEKPATSRDCPDGPVILRPALPAAHSAPYERRPPTVGEPIRSGSQRRDPRLRQRGEQSGAPASCSRCHHRGHRRRCRSCQWRGD